MSIIRSENSHRWINAFIALSAVLIGYITIKSTDFLAQWFELEARLGNISLYTQALGVLVGIASFAYIKSTPKTHNHLREVYAELVRVVWPKREAVVKLSIGILIGVFIVSGILLLIDFTSRWLLDFLY